MPKKLSYHCAVQVDNEIYLHGGFEFPNITNSETFVLHTPSKTWKIISEHPDCGIPPFGYMTVCALWKNNSLVVPTFDTRTEKPCTAILNVKSGTWTKLKEDKRHALLVGGTVAS